VVCSHPAFNIIGRVVRWRHHLHDYRHHPRHGRDSHDGASHADPRPPGAVACSAVLVVYGDIASDESQSRRYERLAGHASIGIVGENRIQHAVGNLISDLVWMSLCDGFRSEQKASCAHRDSPE